MRKTSTTHIFYLICSAILLVCSSPGISNNYNQTDPQIESNSNLSFRENKGQWDSHILYKLNVSSAQIYAEKGQLTWAVHNIEDLEKRSSYLHNGSSHLASNESKEDIHEGLPIIHSHAFKMKFLGANEHHSTYGRDSSLSYSNYFIGNNPDKWATHVYNYKTLIYGSLYDGIDMEITNNGEYLKYEFRVDAGIDPSVIQVKYEGVKELNVVNNHLYVVTSVNEIKELAPYAYQVMDGKKVKVPCFFQVNDTIVSYHLPEGYDNRYELVIDPVLIFASYSGSTADNWGMTATPGPNGELYAGGVVFNDGYPTTTGAYDDSYNSTPSQFRLICDIGITKFSPDGSHVLYATYIGGENSDIPQSMIVNNAGDLVIFGSTSSREFPTTSSAYARTHSGGDKNRNINSIDVRGSDIIITILSEEGDALKGSTFIGGSGDDGTFYNESRLVKNYSDQLRGEVIIDDHDNVYVASVTNSSDFPMKSGFQTRHGGDFDAVIFSMNPDVSDLRWSTYWGGNGEDAAYSIKLDKENNFIVGGGTLSESLFTNFYDAIQPAYQRNIDGFVMKISEDGSRILRGTYIGTNQYDQVYFTEVDEENNIYVYGQSEGDMPVSQGVYYNNGGGMFIQKLSSDLRERLWATRIGSGENIANLSPSAFLVDKCERIYISGWGGEVNRGFNNMSTTYNLPITQDALQLTTDGSDFYFLVLEQDATDLLYASFFGGAGGRGEHVDGGTSRFSKEGIIYQAVCAGCGGTDRFPTSPGAAYENLGSFNCNLGVFKMAFRLNKIIARGAFEPEVKGCAPFKVNFKNTSSGTNRFLWNFGDGKSSEEYEPSHTYTEPGTYHIELIAVSGNLCLQSDTISLEIVVKEPSEDNIETLLLCDDSPTTLSSRIIDNTAEYVWNTGEDSSTIEVNKTGIYTVVTEYNLCKYIDSFYVTYATPQTRIADEIVCDTGALTLYVDGKAENIQWNTGETTPSIEITEDGTYFVSYNIDICEYIDTAVVIFPELPDINVLGETTACEGETITLHVSNTGKANIKEFRWNTGHTGTSITVTEPGEYVVEGITDKGCTDSDTLNLNFIPLKPPLNFPDSTILLCSEGKYKVDLSSYEDTGTKITWSDGSEEYIRTFTETGQYSVTIINQCQNLTDALKLRKSSFLSSDLPVYIPNAFTPNNDGVNDDFRPLFHPDVVVLAYEFEVFDRWGNKVFRTENPDSPWMGTHKNIKLDPDVYVWTMDIEYFLCEEPRSKFRNGDVSLFK